MTEIERLPEDDGSHDFVVDLPPMEELMLEEPAAAEAVVEVPGEQAPKPVEIVSGFPSAIHGRALWLPVDNLNTFDGSHLDAVSAERWSASFLETAGPRIRQCLADNPKPRA